MENSNHIFGDIKRFLCEIYYIKDRNEAERRVLGSILTRLAWTSGGLFIRNVQSTGLIYYTAKFGVFKDFPIRYSFLKGSILEEVLKKGNPCIINSFEEIPCDKSALPFLPYLDKGHHLMFIQIRQTDNILAPTGVPGIIVLSRSDRPFKEEDIPYVLDTIEEYRNLLFFYLSALMSKKKDQVINVSTEMLRFSISRAFMSSGSILEKYLRDVVAIIDGAQRASLLVNTPVGVKFLAVYGYDKEKLLSLPPLSKEDELRWYHFGEENMRKGIPRIITDKEITVLGRISKISDAEPTTLYIKANLAIPITVDGEPVMLLNLDNLETPTAFDDIDIYLAKIMGTYLASAYELITRQRKIERQELLLANLTVLAETLTDEGYVNKVFKEYGGITPEILFQEFKKVLHSALKTFRPYVTKFTYTEEGTPIKKHLEDIPAELRDAVEATVDEVRHKNYVITSFKEYHILALHKVFYFEDKRYHIYILSIKKNDVWTESNIRYLISAANSAILFVKNLKYLSDLKNMQKETMLMLGKALELRDMETKGHTERTAYYTEHLARALNFNDIEGIMWGAYLHDIGKLAIPDYILLKPGRLTKEEFEIMKKHVLYGYQLAKNIKGIPQTTLNVILYHHEKWDGSGYLEGLKGDEIPLEARIFAIVDVFDALTSPRPYKEPWPTEKALQLIKDQRGKHFDPHVVDTFIYLIEKENLLEKVPREEL